MNEFVQRLRRCNKRSDLSKWRKAFLKDGYSKGVELMDMALS